jgi:uncharacterized protein YciI
MLFNIVGYFKPGGAEKAPQNALAFDDHLGQPMNRVPLAGPLRDANGRECGFMALLEAPSFEDAKRFVDGSPNFEAGLYDRVDISQLDVEVGRLS